MKAMDIMTRELHIVTRDEPVSHAASIMAREDVGCVPVVDSPITMHLVGIITDRDIAIRHVAHHHQMDCAVQHHMTDTELVTVREGDHVHDVMGRMRRHQLRRIPVIDEQRRLVGIIAQADVVRHLGMEEPDEIEHMLEAISAPSPVYA